MGELVWEVRVEVRRYGWVYQGGFQDLVVAFVWQYQEV